MALMNPNAIIQACDIWQYQTELERWSAEIVEYDRIFLSDEILELGLIDFSQHKNVVRVPPIVFRAYHPDLCYVRSESGPVRTPLDGYNSAICLVAFKKGLSEADALSLYHWRTYQTAGFFDLWRTEHGGLSKHFSNYGYVIEDSLRRWSLRGPFMYGINHPKIDCLYDVAALATMKAGQEPLVTYLRPHDNLCNGPIFPVYEEIAETLSIDGSYLFKVTAEYRLLTLEQFVTASFMEYRKHDPDRLEVLEPFAETYDIVFNAI